MRDSNKSFSEWLEIMHLVLDDKKSLSINSIYRRSRQRRYETVYHMVRKIQFELGKINRRETAEFFVNFSLSNYSIRMNYRTIAGRKNDKIRLNINPKLENILKLTKLKLTATSSYAYPKIIRNISEITSEIDGVKSQTIQFQWKRKIRNNLIKVMKGMHHRMSDFHIQACLDEYCFKYNYRKEENSNILIFVEKCSSIRKESG